MQKSANDLWVLFGTCCVIFLLISAYCKLLHHHSKTAYLRSYMYIYDFVKNSGALIQFPYGSPKFKARRQHIVLFPSFCYLKFHTFHVLPYFSTHTSLLSFFAALKYSRIFTSAGSICNAKDILPSSEFMYFSGVMSAPLKNRLWETPYFSQ